MVAKRPVLAITSQSSLAASLVAEYKLGEAHEHNDSAGISDAIERFWRCWEMNQPNVFDRESSADVFDALKGAIRLRHEIEAAIREH